MAGTDAKKGLKTFSGGTNNQYELNLTQLFLPL